MELKGKRALVTGAASGIGRAVAETFGREGAAVVVSDIDGKLAEQVAESISRARAVVADVTSSADVNRLFEETLSYLGGLDILITSAGICSLKRFHDITEKDWDRVLAVNLKGTFLCCQAALAEMIKAKSGKIVTISSIAGKIGGLVAGAHYSASKAGVTCLTKSMALYAAPYHINVNCVCPGPQHTPMTDVWGEEINQSLSAKIPFKDYGLPQDVAEAVLYLVSDRSSYITGEVLDVNGGLLMD